MKKGASPDASPDRTAAAGQRGAAVTAGRTLQPGWVRKACALDQGLRAARGDLVLVLDGGHSSTARVTGRNRPYVFGIGDGESPQQAAELAKREQLPFPLIADPERLIARRYSVSSWPATVQVGPGGRVEATDLGLVAGVSPSELTAGRPLLAERKSASIKPGEH